MMMPDFPLPDPEDDDNGAHGVAVESSWPVVQSLWAGSQNMSAARWGSRVGGLAGAGASAASTIASHAGIGGVAGKIGLGAAATALSVGTGGIAVAAAAGAMQIGSMVASAQSFSKTWDHLGELKQIAGRRSFPCKRLGPVKARMRRITTIFTKA